MKIIALSLLAGVINAETLLNFLGASKDDEFEKTRKIAATMDLDSLMANLSGFTLFLPTDAAWEASGGWFEKAMGDEELASDLIFSAAASIPSCTGSNGNWDCIRQEAEANFDLIDTAYGTSYYILEDKVCIAEFTDWYHPDLERCSSVGKPLDFSDAIIFPINSLKLVPPPLEKQLNN